MANGETLFAVGTIVLQALLVGAYFYYRSKADDTPRRKDYDAYPATESDAHQPQERDAHELFELGGRYLHQGDYQAAETAFKKCLQTAHAHGSTIHFSVYGLLGIAQYKIGKFEDALTNTDQAFCVIDLAEEPSQMVARLYYQRSLIHSALGNEQDARRDDESATDLDPDGAVRPRL